MSKSKKHFQILTTLVLLIMAVFSVINATYAYFTTSSDVGGSVGLSGLSVKFVYFEQGSDESIDNDGNTINLYSATGAIAIGTPFQLSTSSGGTPISYLEIRPGSASCDCYIRFWVDAYIKDGNTINKSVNYGKYFELTIDENSYFTNENGSVEDSGCYYGVQAQKANVGINIGNTLTLVESGDNVLAEILGKTLQISITFEAVQAANKAYLSLFDDEKGYFKSWR